MDEQTNKRIEELKRNAPNRAIPVFLLVLAALGVFAWRVATTDPAWDAASASVAARPAPKRTAAPAAAKPATRKETPSTIDDIRPLGTKTGAPQTAATPSAAVQPVQTDFPTAPAEKPDESKANAAEKPDESKANAAEKPAAPRTAESKAKAAAPAADETPAVEPADALGAYLAAHKGADVPFTHRGQRRTVTLVDFTDETVTIRVKAKSLTLKRSALTPEQLALWK